MLHARLPWQLQMPISLSATHCGTSRLSLPYGCHVEAQAKTLKLSFRSRPGSNADVPSFDHTAFEALRDLLARKTDIERRITKSIETLENAMNTALKEFQVVLRSRSEIAATAMPVNTSAVTSDALIVKQ